MNNYPKDIDNNYIYKDNHFIIVKDPKHSDKYFHYTVWAIENIHNIYNITKNFIINLNNFIICIKNNKYFKNTLNNSLMYFTYIPTHNRIHLHIVSHDYVSYRNINELYYYSDIENIYNNIKLIQKIKKEKQNSINLNLKFVIGIIILTNINNIYKLNKIKNDNNIDCIIVIRKKNNDELIDYLLNNNKLINYNLISENLNNYNTMLIHDVFLYA